MAFSPISFIASNYRDYKNNWLKAYEPGTTTPKVMATDSTLNVLIAKAEINADGFIVSASQALIIPYVDGTYDLWLFPSEADADNNDTILALRVADNITGVRDSADGSLQVLANTFRVIPFDTLQLAIDETDTLKIFSGAELNLVGRHTKNDGGGAMWDVYPSGTFTLGVAVFAHATLPLQIKLRDQGALSFKQLGALGTGVDETTLIQSIIDYISASNGTVLTDENGTYGITSIEWKSNVILLGSSFDTCKFVQLSDPLSNIITATSPLSNITIKGFDIGGKFVLPIISTSPTTVHIGGDVTCEDLNSYWHTWRRSDARDTDVFNGENPTFGDPTTYEGTGGLRIYHADAWYVQIFGNQGTAIVTKTLNNGIERNIARSDYHINYVTDSVVPPLLKFNTNITGATSYNSSTMTLTIGTHSLTVNDYIWWDGADYLNGGAGVDIETTFQITGATSTTITFSIVADANFVSWANFGRITDDPDNTSYEHIHDPSLGTIRRSWIRNGTSGVDLGCRVPGARLGGFVTVRLKARHNSGHTGWFPRIFQNYGASGTPNTSTTLSGFEFETGSSDIQEFIFYQKLPDIDGATFGEGAFMQYNFAGSIFEPDVNLDLFEYSVFEGLNIPESSDSSYSKESSIFQKLYSVGRLNVLSPLEAGRFYNDSISYGEPMYGIPTVTLLDEILSTEFTFSAISSISEYGFGISLQANNTVNVGQYLALWESEYQIPTGFVGG